jgi:hypothetical protein
MAYAQEETFNTFPLDVQIFITMKEVTICYVQSIFPHFVCFLSF